MSAAAYQGPIIPLVERAGGPGALARTYALSRVEVSAHGPGLRPEIAPLMDHGLYGSANTALSYYEAHPLPRSLCTALARLASSAAPFQLGVHAQSDIHVAEDRSADLGLALAFYGASSNVPLSHVVATGSLRRGGDADASAPSGQVHNVSSLVEKARHVENLLAGQGSGRLVFVFPDAALENGDQEFAQSLERLGALAEKQGIDFAAKPVATVTDALRELGIRRQAGGGGACAVAAAAVLAVAAYVAADWYMNRTLALKWGEMTLKGKTVLAPSMAMPVEGAANRYDLCQVVRGPDRIALVPFASKLLFAVADEKGELPHKTSMALVTVFEHSSPRVLPLSGAREAMVEGDDPQSRSYTFELLIEAPSEYSRTIVVARRFGAVDLDRLTETISDLHNYTGADRIDAISNLLQTRYPGYVEFGYRSTEADVECNRHP